MKTIIRIWTIVSILLVVFLILKIIDANVSLKYEVYEPRAILGESKSIDDRERSIAAGIKMLYIAVVYVSFVILGCIKFLGIVKKK